MRLRLIHIQTFLGIFLFLSASIANAQSKSEIWIDVDSNVPSAMPYNLIFGNHINGTYGIDIALGEKESPPAPPGFFSKWIPPRSGIPNYPSAGMLTYDYRAYTGSAQKDTFKLYFNQADNSTADITITWPDAAYLGAHCTALKMKIGADFYDMFTQTTITIPAASDNGIQFVTIYKTGVTLVEFDKQNPPALLSPANNATNVSITPWLQWRHVASGVTNTYQIQVATDAAFTNIVKDSSLVDSAWHVGPLLNCTNYYWRGKTSNSNGVSDWSAAWTFKTIAIKPAAPALVSPADNATGIILTPTLSWSTSDVCTDSYHLQVAKDAGFTNIVVDRWTTQTSQVLSTLEQGTYYYWHVKAINSADSSDYSTSRNFQTVILGPPTPQMVSPVNGDSTLDPVVLLRWRTTSNTNFYHVQLATDQNFTSLIINDSTLTDTFKTTTSLTNCQKYYWRVRAKNAVGASAYSTAWNFRIIPVAPTSPALTSPANDATGISLTPTLSWSAGDICSYSYRLQVAKDSLFTTVVWNEYLAQTSRQLTTLEEDAYYYWKVKAINPVDSSQFTQYRRFKTLFNPPAAPQLISPSNGVTDVEPVATLLWHSTVRTNSYHLQIATDLNFTALIFNDSTLTDTSKVTAPLINCNLYYWRVRGKNSAGAGSFSSTRNFKILPLKPLTPALVSPADNATDITLTPTLSWSASDICSYTYHLQVAKDTTSTNIIADVYTNLTSRTLSTLELNTDYYWHVKSLNPVDSSEYTAYRKFTTFQQQPPAPTLASPAAGDTNQSPTGALIWNAALYTEFYHLQIATDQNFTPLSLVVNDSTLTNVSYTPSALTNCKWYYWRVSAKNGAGKSDFSTTWSFKVQTAVPGIPNQISPYNTQDSLSEMVRLTWNKADICTQKYFYHVSRSASFTDTVVMGQTTDTTFVIGPIPGNVYFYWHVQAVNFLGSGSFSPTWQFHTTISRPTVPALLSPADSITDMPSGFTLMWDSAAFATSYRIQVALDIYFANLKVNDSTIIRQPGILPSKTISSLLNSTTYYWRVNAKNQIGISAWSTVWRFTTLFPPAAPELNIPYNGATEVPITPQFDWSIAQRADLYRLQVAEDTEFSRPIFDDSTISILSWQITNPLKSLSKYYWRVRGKNSVGWGAWSSVNNFTTTRTGVANWLIPLTISETGPAYATIYFGVHPSATAGIDPALGEYALPPIDQWYFDARFISPFIGEGLLVNILKFNNYAQIDTFQFTFQPEPGLGSYPMKVSWSNTFVKSICDSMVIKDQLTSPTVYTRMDRDSFVTVSNTSTRSLYIVKYGTFPLPLDVKPPIAELPKGFMLYQNYPNPFNPSTNITFSIDKTAKIQIKVFDVLGRELTTIADASFLPGQYTLQWNGKDVSGDAMPSGVYYVRMIAAGISDGSGENARYINTRKMIMLK